MGGVMNWPMAFTVVGVVFAVTLSPVAIIWLIVRLAKELPDDQDPE